jgi:predicted dehydrogenase
MNRRYFLMSAAAGAAVRATALGSPNDTIRVAVVGLRGQGNGHIRAYQRMPNVEIAALVDIDESILDRLLAEVEKATGKKPARYVDIRQMLEDKTIDCVSIATPNHHHTLQAIWSLQAGKHVYVEKPCSHNVFESRQIVAAARKYGKLVQHGVQAHSSPALQEAKKMLEEGVIGDVYMTRGLCFKWRDTIGRAPVEPVPAGVHYDLWLGPAPKREFTRNRFHYNWHWFWDYGNGDFGNQGIHEVDICRWLLGVKLPTRVSAMGGHFMFDDDQETPNVLVATYEFDVGGKKKFMTFEVRHWITNHEAGIGERPGGDGGGNTVGNIFYGSKGYMAIDGYDTYKVFLGRKAEPGPEKRAGGSHHANFIEAVRAGKPEMLNGPIDEGAISCTLMHLANISYRVGRSLKVDPETGDIIGDAEASALMTRNYRAPFVVPAKV